MGYESTKITQINILDNKKKELIKEVKKVRKLIKQVHKITDSFLPFIRNALKLELIELQYCINEYLNCIDQEIEKIDIMTKNLERNEP